MKEILNEFLLKDFCENLIFHKENLNYCKDIFNYEFSMNSCTQILNDFSNRDFNEFYKDLPLTNACKGGIKRFSMNFNFKRL